MFEDTFDKIFEKNQEIKCIGIWGKDGLELEKKGFSPYAIDIELMGAQLADAFSRFESVTLSSLNHSLRVFYPEYILLVFSLTADYFLVIVSERTIIPGKIDFYVKLYKDKFISAF